MGRNKYPKVPQKPRDTCPLCHSGKIRALPPISAGSYLDWFHCMKCDHMWYHRRGYTVSGEYHP
jgi:transposase-like protein